MVHMADKKSDTPEYPKFYKHAYKANRVAGNATDAVNLEARGYKLDESAEAQKVAEQVSPQTDAEKAKAEADAKKAASTTKPNS